MRSYHCYFWYENSDEKEYGSIDAETFGEAVEKCYDLFEKEPSLEEVDFWNDAASDLFMELSRFDDIAIVEFWTENN